jgi:hypothetical protein
VFFAEVFDVFAFHDFDPAVAVCEGVTVLSPGLSSGLMAGAERQLAPVCGCDFSVGV